MKTENISGYIAISSILVIAAVVLIVGTTVSLLSINEGQISLSSILNDKSLDTVEGCAEEALLYLNENDSLPASISTLEGSCAITVNSHAGTSWDITLTGTVQNHTKKVRIQLTRSSTIIINSWNEI